MKKITILGVFLATALLMSCSKDTFDDPTTTLQIGVERTINASATMPQNNDDKAYLDGYKVKWSAGDQLNINGGILTETAIRNYEEHPWASFSGTTYAIANGANEIYWAVYPASLAGTYNNGIPSNFEASKLTYTYPSIQTFNSSVAPMQGSTYMACCNIVPAGETHLFFEMKNLGVVIKVHLTADAGVANKHVKRLIFSTTTRNISGQYTASADGFHLNPVNNKGSKCVAVNLTDGTHDYIDITHGADVYVMLPPFNAGSNLTMRVYNTDEDVMMKTKSSISLSRNHLYTTDVNVTAFTAPEPYFSNSASTKVAFAPGNLRYVANNNTWQFARKQYLFVGNARGNTTATANRPSQSDTIDLFGWGTSGWDNGNVYYQPYDNQYTNNSAVGYGYGPTDGSFYEYNLTGTYEESDWGVHNDIYNPKTGTLDLKKTWRTPTLQEWEYIVTNRSTPSGLHYARATVNNIHGVLLLPDSWCECLYILDSVDKTSTYAANIISLSDWETVLEPAGVVFLPASGMRLQNSNKVQDAGNCGWYWSSTPFDNYSAWEQSLFQSGGYQFDTEKTTKDAVLAVRSFKY